MGCVHSSKYKETSCEKVDTYQTQLKLAQVPRGDLTENEILIVKSTWNYMTTDLSGNGLQVFLKIFELCPEVKKLFHVDNVRLSEVARNEAIKAHGARFLNAIGAAVNSLHESCVERDKFREVLFALGQQHKRHSGFKPEYFEIFYTALMWRWEICLGEKFTQEVSDTWSHVFVYMMETLKEGCFSKEVNICIY
ncbi:uncharacterized protein LOC123548093 [Mercenaria mercenaria]|uniref:uncharacterized protein LOC123548093 n=1 Tax=Mercenaria mercenaria TaxID=6596 RepID=UPI001E1D3A9B|nr:uncharacterized protein LOC123548093 [Mercenaria mercenaria]